jgi:hypothetical protein
MRMMLLLVACATAFGGDLTLNCFWERKFYRGGGEPNVSHTGIEIRTKGKTLEGRIDGAGYKERLANGAVEGSRLRFTTGAKGDRLYAQWELTHTPGKGAGQLDGTYRYPDGIIGKVTAKCLIPPARP